MSQLTHNDWYRAIREEVRRDANAELIVRVEGADGQPLRKVYRSRIFQIDADGTMIAERPDAAALDEMLGVGQAVAVMVVNHGQRLMAESQVLEVVSQQVNAQLRLTCLRLKRGEKIRIDQRRAFFRAKSATTDHAEIRVEDACPGGRWAITGLLVNVGGGGLGIVVRGDRRMLREAQEIKRFNCMFHLDSEDQDIEVATRLAHLSAMENGRLYFGMELVLPEGKPGQDLQDRMVQFGAWLQRQSLKKRRRA